MKPLGIIQHYVLDRLLADNVRHDGLRRHLYLIPELLVAAMWITYQSIVTGVGLLLGRGKRRPGNGFQAIHTHNRIVREREQWMDEVTCEECSGRCGECQDTR